MTRKPTLREQLDALIEELSPVLRDAFLQAIVGVTSDVVLADLIVAIEAQDYALAAQTLNITDASMRPLTRVLADIFETAGNTVAQSYPRLRQNGIPRLVFHFDGRSPRAENYLKEQSARLVTAIQEDVRVNIQTIASDNLSKGVAPRTTALDIVGRINAETGKREGGIIGLTQQQETWVRNARRDLETLDKRYFSRLRRDKRFDSVVQNAIHNNTPLDTATIDKLISRYKDTLLRLRGETIARTETIQSLNRAEWESAKQAIDSGAAKPSDVQREWVTAHDSRVRHNHVLMDKQLVGIDEPFTTPDGEKLMHPGDTSLGADASETIQCRCIVRLKVDFFDE